MNYTIRQNDELSTKAFPRRAPSRDIVSRSHFPDESPQDSIDWKCSGGDSSGKRNNDESLRRNLVIGNAQEETRRGTDKYIKPVLGYHEDINPASGNDLIRGDVGYKNKLWEKG
jgi:hypothetical protein